MRRGVNPTRGNRAPGRNRGDPAVRLLLMRIATAAAAAGLVCGFALLSLAPADLTLGTALQRLEPHALPVLHGLSARLAPNAWRDLALPLLVRPAWLLPTAIGLVAGGIALTIRPRT
jgi:hypothetical protein